MEWLATLLIVATIVLLIGGLFAAGGARGPWSNILWFFIILFVGTMAFGAWVQPVGPQPWGVPWLSFLIIAVLIALLIAASTPDTARDYRRAKRLPLQRDTAVQANRDSTSTNASPATEETATGTESDAVGAATAVGVFFWIFVVVAASVLLLRLFFAIE